MKAKVLIPLLILLLVSCTADPLEDRIRSVSDMGYLETVRYELKLIVRNEPARLEEFKPGKRVVLYSYVATVTSGIDLSKLSADNFDASNGRLTITLQEPDADDLIVEMDESSIKKEFEKVDILRTSFSNAEREELRRAAEKRVWEKIEEYGILEDAKENAVSILELLFEPLGYEEITVKFVNNE